MLLTKLTPKSTTNKDTIWLQVPKSYVSPSKKRKAIRETITLLEQTLIIKYE